MLNPFGNKELMRTLYPKSVRCIIQLPFGHCEGCEIEIVIVYKNSFVVVLIFILLPATPRLCLGVCYYD